MGIEYEKEQAILENLILRQSFDQLPERYQAVICLTMAGYNQKECGLILGVTQSAISFIYRKAIRMLREAIEES